MTCAYRADKSGAGEQRLVPSPASRPMYRGEVRATITTNLGPLVVVLDADRAPCTVHSFAHLVREDYYTETTCHRITTEGLWVLQCGDPTGTGTGTPGYRYDEENLPIGLSPAYRRGKLAMANAGPGTNGSQFFVTVAATPWLDGKHTIFGEVTEGYEVIEAIAGTPTASQDRPVDDVVIDRIELTD